MKIKHESISFRSLGNSRLPRCGSFQVPVLVRSSLFIKPLRRRHGTLELFHFSFRQFKGRNGKVFDNVLVAGAPRNNGYSLLECPPEQDLCGCCAVGLGQSCYGLGPHRNSVSVEATSTQTRVGNSDNTLLGLPFC